MSAELAHKKPDTHFCVAHHRKVRIRLHPSTESMCGIARGSRLVCLLIYTTESLELYPGTLSVNKVKNDVFSSLIPIIIRKFAK